MVATLADAATADIFQGTRSQKISVAASGEGMYKAWTVVAQTNKVVRAILKSDGSNIGQVRIYDNDNAADVLTLTTTSATYVELTGCFQVPVGCTTIRVYVEAGDNASYDIHLAQLQILPNLVVNPSMEGTYDDESGGGGGTVNVAPGWNKYGVETDGTDTLDESATAHSGSKSQQINVDAANEGIASAGTVFTANKWHLVTAWFYGIAGIVRMIDTAGAFFAQNFTPPAGVWTRYSFVVYANSARYLGILSSGAAANFLVDDVSVCQLNDVSITCVPASLANSQE